MIYIFNEWNKKSEEIYNNNHVDNNDIVISIDDNGFLPNHVLSPYRIISGLNYKDIKEKPVFAPFLNIPELWEVIMYFSYSEIWDEGELKAIAYNAEPVGQQNIKSVKWLKNNKAYKIDNYDKYGNLLFYDLLDNKEELEVRIFLNNNKPVFMYQQVFSSYTLFNNGKPYRMLKNRREFLDYLLKEYYPNEKTIYSNDDEIIKDLKTSGYKSIKINRVVRKFPINIHNKEALIFTNSDNLEHIKELITTLNDINFHIAARTNMSDKLLSLKEYNNVFLYPNINLETKNLLLNKCSIYLDINHYNEMDDAIFEAYKHNMLIFAFDNTIHGDDLINEECVFDSNNYNELIDTINKAYNDISLFDELLVKQNKKCLLKIDNELKGETK